MFSKIEILCRKFRMQVCIISGIIQMSVLFPAFSSNSDYLKEKYQGVWLITDTIQYQKYTTEKDVRGFIFNGNWPKSYISAGKEAGLILPSDLKPKSSSIEWPNVDLLKSLPNDTYIEKYITFLKLQLIPNGIYFIILPTDFIFTHPSIGQKLIDLSNGFIIPENVFVNQRTPSKKTMRKTISLSTPLLLLPGDFEQIKKWINNNEIRLLDTTKQAITIPENTANGLLHELMQAGITLLTPFQTTGLIMESSVAFWSDDPIEAILWEQLLLRDFISVRNVKNESLASGVWVILDARHNYEEALSIQRQLNGYHPILWIGIAGQWPSTSTEAILIVPQNYEGATFDLSSIISQKNSVSGVFNERLPDQLQGYKVVVQNTGQNLTFHRANEIGTHLRSLDSLDILAKQLVTEYGSPGGQFLVAKNGKIIKQSCFGYLTYDSLIRVENHTLYDLASVTKVMATTLAAMLLYDQGKLPLDSPLVYYLPQLVGTSKEQLTIKELMTHNAGLRSYVPFWKKWINMEVSADFQYSQMKSESQNSLNISKIARDSLYTWLISSEVDPESERHFRYSDLGFILLQYVIEAVSGKTLEDYVNQHFYQPLGLRRTVFKPKDQKVPLYQIAPTEYDYYFRKELVWGIVHDNNAAILGGVSGHAGLFSTAFDLAVLMQMLIQEGNYGGKQYISSSTVQLFNQSYFQSNHRALGWDKRSDKANYISEWASESSFGHTGYTGTMVWADPAYELIFILLTNRVYPNAENRNFHRLETRKKMHDLVYKTFITER